MVEQVVSIVAGSMIGTAIGFLIWHAYDVHEWRRHERRERIIRANIQRVNAELARKAWLTNDYRAHETTRGRFVPDRRDLEPEEFYLWGSPYAPGGGLYRADGRA